MTRKLTRVAALTVLTWAPSTVAAGIDSDSQTERALANDEHRHSGSLGNWYKPVNPRHRAASDEAPALTEAQLRAVFPDLQVQTSPSIPFKVVLGIIAPFQLYAVGIGTDLYVLPRLRLNAIVTLGATLAHPYRKEWELNVYGEAGVGVAVLRWPSSTTVTWPVPRLESKPSTGNELKVDLPSSHSLEVEGGIISGHAVLFRCTADCAPQPTSWSTYLKAARQVVMPYAGLRYVYFRRAWSARAHIGAKQQFQLAADVVFRPFVQPASDLVNLSADRIGRRQMGFRVMSQLPFFGCSYSGRCVGVEVGAGYLPSPADLFLTLKVTTLWTEAG